MPILHHVLSIRLVAAGAAVLTAGAAALFGSFAGNPRSPSAAMTVAGPSWARPPVVPAGDADLSTDWEATTDPNTSVLFSYHRSDSGCGGPCEHFGVAVHFAEPSRGGAQPSGRWQAVADANCASLIADGASDDLCADGYPMAGRDRHGNDYVLLQMYAKRGQLVRMLTSRKVAFRVGSLAFGLSPAADSALRAFIGTAGRGMPQ